MSGTTTARIAKRFVGLSLDQRRQFLAKLRADGKDFTLLPIPECRHDVTAIPLSYAQQRLLFLWQLDPTSDAYKMSTALRLRGQLDDSALQRAFDLLLQRHEVLRTVFNTEGEQPRQVIQPPLSLEVERVDLEESELAARAGAFVAKPFDLRQGPLLRACLFHLGAGDHVLVVCMHHIVSDGWSMEVMVKEFAQSYQAFSQGAEPDLPALPLQYADYAIWQRQWLEAGEGERQLDYWRRQLGDEQPLLEAAQDFPRPPTQSFRGEHLKFDFGRDLSQRLNAFARSQGMSLFMLVLAGFSLFLSRQSGQRDIRIGVPNANRGRSETEGLIGFFINTQVLRCQLDERLSYLDLLAQVRETSFEAQAHQDVPFEQLVDQLAPERSLGHNPLFQAKFNQHVMLKQELSLKLPGLEVSEYPMHREGAHFDLALDITDDGSLVHGDMAYASDLYQRSTVEGFIPQLLQLFEQLLDAPQAPLYSLGALPQPAAAETLPVAPSVLAQWQANVERQPDAIAARCLTESLTYRELDEAANRLAHQLLQQGVESGQPVAVLMERSLPWLTSLLAIFKAGAVYMPLDVKAPAERLQQMLDRAGARAVLRAEAVARLDVPVDIAWQPALWAQQPATAPAIALHEQSPAYVIHTSGSTGQPKGVLVSHGALASYVRGLLARLQPAPEASMALASTIAADLGHTVLFGALCAGRTLHVLPEALGFDPDGFADYMATHQVGVLKIVPGHLAALLQAARPADVLPRQMLIVGGEACPAGLVERVRELRPQCRFINHYGPSETTVGVLTHEVTGEVPPVVPVGSALPGAVVRMLDDVFNGVAERVPGELYIGGDSLALGYLGQPALTAERFVPDPHGPAGARLYRSGDRVRRNPEGNLEFIGRADDQVKIRGYRVEPAEVARVLQGLVQQAVVLAVPQDDDASRLQLLAWVVADGVTAESLRQQLAQVLPDYMVPAQIVLLEQLPLTANGKLDKRALPKPGAVQQRYVAPQGEIEEKLAAIWREVLKLEQVGSTDNFFELGGDSILSLQIIARAKRQGIKLNPKQLFEKQTIGQLATVAKLIEKKAAAPVVELVSGNLPLLPIQARFFELDIPQRQHWNQSVLLKPAQKVDATHLQSALHALLEHHDALRLNFARQYAGWQAVFAPLDSTSLLWTRTTDDLDAVADEAQRSLDLKSGPLLRAVLVDLADGSQRLLLVIHHLVVDGVSWRVLLEDLQQAYTALAAGRAPALPAKTSSYKDWAEKLHGYANSPALEAERDYWRGVLDGAADSLPQDNPQGSLRVQDAAHATSRFDAELTTQLLKVAPAAYRTQVNDLLLTALAQVLCQWSGQPSVRVQLEGHGREDLFDSLDLSRTVGWFSSLFPVRLTPGAGPAASICAIKEQLRGVPAKGIGFGVLRYLGDGDFAHELAALPQPRVTFNYLGQFDGSFEQDAAFGLAAESSGQPLCPEGPLGNWLGINGQVFDGQLRLDWTYSREMFRSETIEALARDYERALQGLIEHCASGQQGVTPSDFPLAALTQEQLDRLPVAAASIEDIYPLSPMQQGMLFHSLYAQGGGDYVNQLRVSVDGLDAARLHEAWQGLLDRHEVLRSSFVSDAAQPVQVVQRHVALPFVEIDARGRDGLDAWLDDWARLERDKGFELTRGPLLRVALIRTADDSHELIYTSHHILMDGWSSSRMLGEVLQRYAGQAPVGQGSQYRDYIRWLQQQDAAAGERFWLEQLAAFDEPTRLAQALKGAGEGEGYGDHLEDLDAGLTRRLGEFAREQRVTLNTLVQAAWLLLLQRYTGQSSVTFGATVAGRPSELAGVEEQLGLFINTLPVVASPRSEQSVAEFVQQVQAQNLALREFEHTPLYEVQRWAGWSGEALFDNILVFENYPISDALQQAAPDGLVFGDVRTQEQTHYPLTLVVNTGERLSLRISHDRRHFGERAVAQLAAHFNHLLAALIADPQARLGQLALPVDEMKAVARFPGEQCIHQLIEAQAARSPEAVAVSFAGEQLTYAQLNARANQLAHKLREQGVGPDVLVGLSVERSLDMLVGVLGILKAGGAYVPLDPDYPQDRLDFMTADSGIKLLLTQADLQSLAGYSEENPVNLTTPDNLAYVIYTSGSTGKPKGALLPHSNVLRLFKATDAWFGFDEKDVWTLFHSYAFDFSVWEIFGALMYGGRLVVVPREVTRSPDDFHKLLVSENVTVLNQTPSAFKQLARVACESTSEMSLRYVVFGGEALDVGSLQPWFDRFGDQQPQLINMYGITETTVHVTYRPISKADLQQAEVSPIGEAIPDLSLVVLDTDFNPVAPGVCGELHVGHAGLARGYHNRAALTAERFVPNPFAADGSRLYRTGDLARFRDEDVIEYAGRIDHQVKIRGFRIELGEIEARLQEHEAVREVIVLAVDGPAGQQLVAYLVPSGPQADLRDTLKAHLKANLPDYMVPAHLIVLDAMPLTANGKLDRKALPKPDASAAQGAYVAPVSELEQQLAAIWADVLQLEKVGLTDNFFELGGHSLLATQVVSRVRQQLDLELSLRDLFESADLAAFAAAAQQGPASKAPALLRADRAQPLALSYAQQRQWFLWQLEPDSAAYNIPVALRLDGALDIEALESSFSALIARHETLRTTFRQDGEQAVQIVHSAAPLVLAVEALPAGESLEDCIAREVRQPFDLQQGPLLRVKLLHLGEDRHVLVLTQHHSVSDGWSMPIMVDELVRLYEGFSQGRETRLDALPIQYADYAQWQRQWMAAGEQQRQLDYWTAQLGGEQPVLELPTDRPRPAIQQLAGARHAIALEPALVDNLKAVARQQGVTLFMLLLAAFQTLLQRHSGQADIRVGVPIANRTRAETEKLIGFFVNTQVLKAEFSADATFAELLQQVKHTALQAQAHQELPFEQLVEALQPQRSLSHSPLFQVMFNHQAEVRGTAHQLPGLSVEVLGADSQSAQFDLTLNTVEHAAGLDAELSYATALFDAATIARLAGHWRNLLQGICANANQRIAELPLLDADERQRILVDWNQSQADYPREKCLPALIEAQVQATPDATALVLGDITLSYAQLNAHANQLAHKLRELGVGPDVLVGVALERSAEMLVGLLAILKAGGAYVPLDPDFPRDRLAYMMEDSGLKLLLSQSSLLDQLTIPAGVQTLCLDQEGDWLDGYSQDNLPASAAPENLAYVIYTSGSTGLPKGVTLQHQSLVNFLFSMVDQPGLSADDRVLSLTSLSFDIAGLELYLPLIRGASVVLLKPHQNKDPQALLQVIAEQQVSLIQATPSSWQMILDAAPAGVLKGKTILCGGEALSAELAQRLIDQAGHVWNVYGPTETTIWSARHYLTRSADVWLGKPLANTSLHIVSDDLDVLPVGARGELLIGGDGLARGYHQRPSLTAQRFVPDPFSKDGGRLYRTGDVARYQADGVIEYVGRLDHQVKIRGYRIELGEIESRLLEHPAVHQAVVIDIDLAGHKQLAAYLVAEADSAELRNALKAHLRGGLPDYMVPGHLVWLDAMPQTPNGKLDRKALPAPDASLAQRAWVAPASEQEQQMAAIWAEVLKVERVGLTDDFFELGGHSLLAAQLVSRIQSGLGIDVPLRLIFEKPQLNEFLLAFADTGLSLTEDGLSDIEKLMNEMAGA